MTKSEYKIGICGFGFLGTAVSFGFSPCLRQENIRIYDKYKQGFGTFEDTIRNSDIIFMCLPTPAFKDNGQVDLSALEENIERAHNMVDKRDKKIIVVKSTVPPGTTDMFAQKYPKLRFVMNPEFLTGSSAKLDFISSHRVILGGDKDDVKVVEGLYRERFGQSVLIFNTGRKEAEMVKYMCNLFFATKVTFLNVMYDVCDEMGMEFDSVRDMFFADSRIGRSHMNVPGNDIDEHGNKLRGFGNLCFPKDLASFIYFMQTKGLDANFLQSVWSTNLRYRPDKDWEKITGAFSDR